MAPPILCFHGDLHHITLHHHPLTRCGTRSKLRPQTSIIHLTVRCQAGTLTARQLHPLIRSEARITPQATITPPHLTTRCEAGRKPQASNTHNILTNQARTTPHSQAPLTHQTLTVKCQARTPQASQHKQFFPGHTAGWSEVQQLWHC